MSDTPTEVDPETEFDGMTIEEEGQWYADHGVTGSPELGEMLAAQRRGELNGDIDIDDVSEGLGLEVPEPDEGA